MPTANEIVNSIEATGAMVLLLGGLPGSGKSPISAELERRGWLKFGSFQKNAPGDSSEFCNAARCKELIKVITSGKRCVVTDIRLIHAPYREGAFKVLGEVMDSQLIHLQLFENNPSRCASHVVSARDPSLRLIVRQRLENLDFWKDHYSLPPGSTAIPVLAPEL